MRRLLVSGLVLLLALAAFLHWRTVRYDAYVREACSLYELDFHLVKSIIREESNFNASARGRAGELGLMQVMPYVGLEYWDKHAGDGAYDTELLLDPRHNIQVGSWYLRTSLDLYRDKTDPLPYALARYNAGHSRVARWMDRESEQGSGNGDFVEQIGFPQTREYVRRVMDRSKRGSRIYVW